MLGVNIRFYFPLLKLLAMKKAISTNSPLNLYEVRRQRCSAPHALAIIFAWYDKVPGIPPRHTFLPLLVSILSYTEGLVFFIENNTLPWMMDV